VQGNNLRKAELVLEWLAEITIGVRRKDNRYPVRASIFLCLNECSFFYKRKIRVVPWKY